MSERDFNNTEILDGIDVQPRQDTEMRLTTQSSFLGFTIAAVLIGMFIVLVATHFNPIAMAWLVLLAVALVAGTLWNRVSVHRRGTPANLVLTTRIKADLLTDLNATDVHVESAKGVVTLRGTVPYANFREAAAGLARRAGARRVINELKVAETAAKPTDDYLQGFAGVSTPEGAPEVDASVTPEERLYEALEADPRVNANLIEVRVDLGIATLIGRQGTVQASQAAIETAAHLPGILGVANEIEVAPVL